MLHQPLLVRLQRFDLLRLRGDHLVQRRQAVGNLLLLSFVLRQVQFTREEGTIRNLDRVLRTLLGERVQKSEVA